MSKQLHIHLDDEDHIAFAALARAQDLSMSQLSRRIIRDYIDALTKKNNRTARRRNQQSIDSDDTNT